MIRRLLRAIRRRPAEKPPPPAAPDPPPDERYLDAAALSALTAPLCVDLRPMAALRYGFVEGAWLLESLADLPPTDRVVVLLVDEPEQAAALGHPVTWGGLEAWRATGAAIREPEWKSPLPLRHPVSVGGKAGWIQDVAWGGAGFVYTVLLTTGQRRSGLEEEDIASRGPRGAAGLGEVV